MYFYGLILLFSGTYDRTMLFVKKPHQARTCQKMKYETLIYNSMKAIVITRAVYQITATLDNNSSAMFTFITIQKKVDILTQQKWELHIISEKYHYDIVLKFIN